MCELIIDRIVLKTGTLSVRYYCKTIYSENNLIISVYIPYWKVVFLRTLFNCSSSLRNPVMMNNLNMKERISHQLNDLI